MEAATVACERVKQLRGLVGWICTRRATVGTASVSTDRIQAQRDAPGEAMLSLWLQRMELRTVEVAHKALEAQVAEESATSNHFERFLDST